jgi:hypothetical protein
LKLDVTAMVAACATQPPHARVSLPVRDGVPGHTRPECIDHLGADCVFNIGGRCHHGMMTVAATSTTCALRTFGQSLFRVKDSPHA